MLVIFGANGRTGRALLEAAIARNIEVRPVVRDDRDARGLDTVVDVDRLWYADADHKSAIVPVLDGATAVVSCISPRVAGPGSPPYAPDAGTNIIECAVGAGIHKVVHISVVGAYRWSPNKLNRAAFRLDRLVWKLKELPWTMFRISCFFDEIIEGHVRPPDGGRPHPIKASARYSPVSRRDVAGIVLAKLEGLDQNRTYYVGGPETFTGQELQQACAPWVQPGGRRRTAYGMLPPSDMSVAQETTQVAVGYVPSDRLEWALDPARAPSGSVVPAAVPTPEDTPPVYQRGQPGPHPADEGRDLEVLRRMGDDLRRVVHDQLVLDLARLGVPTANVRLDFRTAKVRTGGRVAQAHGGTIAEMSGVRAVAAGVGLVHKGVTTFLRDPVAEELRCWWDDGGGIPREVWEALDMGVRRRLAREPAFAEDALVRGFAGGHEVVEG